MPDHLDELASSLQQSTVITDPSALEGYRRDEADAVHAGMPCAVLVARSVPDICTAMDWARTWQVPVVPRGAGTGLAGGAAAVDGALIISTARLTDIRELEADDEYAVVEAGVITADLDRAAAEHGLMYAPDPSSFESSTIGGNVATNAGGLRCVKYGVTRDSVMGLEVVLADGRILNTGRRTIKGVAGLDLTGLFVGSEGTLGIITAATVRLRPRPVTPPATLVASFAALASAGDAVRALIRQRVSMSLCELMDRTTLRAIDDWKNIGLEPGIAAMLLIQADVAEQVATATDALRAAGATDVEATADPQEISELLGIRRLAYPATARLGRTLVEDVAVPRSRLTDMVAAIERIASEHDVTIATVAHAGDGNLHPVFVFDAHLAEPPDRVWLAADQVFRTALDFGGTLTGEHGVGALKRDWLASELGDVSMDVHQAIKAALDPTGILNPGKVLDAPRLATT